MREGGVPPTGIVCKHSDDDRVSACVRSCDCQTYTSLPLLTGVMTSLQASSSYFYRVGNDAAGWSPEYSFVSMPDQTALHNGVTKFLVVGGQQQEQRSARTSDRRRRCWLAVLTVL